MQKKIKIGFFGTPELSRAVLQEALESDFCDIAFVVTNPDKPVGRKQSLTPSPVKILAEQHHLPIFQPEKIRNNDDFIKKITEFQCDYFVVVAYGKILPKEILDIPKKLCINIHGSILPKYRGASPIQSALLCGEQETGVTIMKMSEKMDEGDILFIEKIPIESNETALTLFEKFGKIAPKTLLKTLQLYENNAIIPEVQDEKSATYCTKIAKEDGKIDWNRTASEIYHQYQAYTPWPWIFAFYKGKRVLFEKISWKKNDEFSAPKIVQCDEKIGVQVNGGVIFPEIVKPEGKKSQNFLDFLNGNADFLKSGFDRV